MDTFIGVQNAFSFLFAYWWLYLPFLMFFTLLYAKVNFGRMKYISEMKWVLLELTLPPDVQKSPKIAENIYSGLHGIYNKPLKWKKKFFQGKVPDWFSLEIVGNSGDIRFYIRTPEEMRNLVEAQIFAQYPDAEVKVAEDYVELLPRSYRSMDAEYSMFGTELIFTKDNAYPIKTYPFFEEESGKDEFRRTDPLTPLLELLSSLGNSEHLWVQLVVRPTGGEWVEKSKEVVDKIVGKKVKPKVSGISKVFDAIDFFVPGGASGGGEEKKDSAEFNVQKLTPRQKFALEQVENKISKLGFKAGYRILYIARKEAFNKSRVPTLIGMFKQLYANDLNSFKPNGDTITLHDGYLEWIFPSDRGFFADQKELDRKAKIYQKYRKRSFVKKLVILNTEELATLFHLPGIGVKTPFLPRVGAIKGQPPTALPTK